MPTKICLVKAMFFPVVIYGYESWTIKKAGHKNWCFWIVVLEKVLRVPWICKEIKPVSPNGNQTWIFIGRTDAEAETPILWPPDAKSRLIRKRLWCWEKLKAGGEGDGRGWDDWMASSTQWTWVWANSERWWRTGKLGMLQSMRLQTDTTERLNNNFGTRRVFSFFDYPRESGENPQGLRLTSCQSGVWVLSHIKLSWETFK